MKNIAKQDLFKKTVHWLLSVLVILYLVTGFGITKFRTVETVTFGLLPKNLAFKIHNNLWIPFIVLLGLHIFLSRIKRKVLVDLTYAHMWSWECDSKNKTEQLYRLF